MAYYHLQAVLFLILVTLSSCVHYHIVPTQSSDSCHDHPNGTCLTLNELAVLHSQLSGLPDLTLSLLPGQHILDRLLRIQNITSVQMIGGNSSEISFHRNSAIKISAVLELCIESVQFSQQNSSELISQSPLTFSRINNVSLLDCFFTGFNLDSNQYGINIQKVVELNITNILMESNTGLGLHIQSDKIHIMNSFFGNLRGRGIDIQSGDVLISSTQFENNVIMDTVDYGRHVQTRGVLYIHSGNVFIDNSNFTNNTDGAIHISSGNVDISHCWLVGNSVGTRYYGGAIFVWSGDVSVHNSMLENNSAGRDGGAISVWSGSLSVHNSALENNSAGSNGGAIYSVESGDVSVHDSTLENNSAGYYGGAIFIRSGDVSVHNSMLENNSAGRDGGAIYVFSYTGHDIEISYTEFSDNIAKSSGGAIYAAQSISMTLSFTQLTDNHARFGGAIASSGKLNILNTNLTSNSAESYGGAIDITLGVTNITSSILITNDASNGGALYIGNANVYLTNTYLIKNNARIGGAIVTSADELILTTCSLTSNVATSDGGAIDIPSGVVRLRNSRLSNNSANRGGALFINQGHLHFSSTMINNNSAHSQGGAIYASTSSDIETEHEHHSSGVTITYNTAMSGGGLYMKESTLTGHSLMEVTHNTADDGGGLYAVSSKIDFNKNGTGYISNNIAHRNGAGIHATSARINIIASMLIVQSNKATAQGGGIYLQQNSKINLLKRPCMKHDCTDVRLTISHNFADYGGGIYVEDDTVNGDLCEGELANVATKECFLQTKYYYKRSYVNVTYSHINTYFVNNTAMESGSDLFGGLLDRCVVQQYAESRNNFTSGRDYFNKNVSHSNSKESISSRPLRVIFCDSKEEKFIRKEALRGQSFRLKVAAIDQVGRMVKATIHSSVTSGRLEIEQPCQQHNIIIIGNKCTELDYSIFSKDSYSQLELYADGPCTNMGISKRTVNVTFLPCECPIGFRTLNQPTKCSCECDPILTDNGVSNCYLKDGTMELSRNNMYTGIDINVLGGNTTNGTGYIIYDCPFDYCKEKPLNISLNSLHEIDQQCAHNRSGLLCGECAEGLSLVLATSKCKVCANTTLLLIIPFALAGIALVAFLLVFNITIATGTLHGLVFFANILAASKETFLPFPTPNFLTIFISWVNLDLGIEICFYNGMTSQGKVLLQLAFPVYVFVLIFLIIIGCKYSTKFSHFLSNRNPVAVLCTLIVLSYSKLLRTIIAALQYATINYPDNSGKVRWLYDANVEYFASSHVPQFVAAAIILTAGGLFTVLLLFGQWFPRCSQWKLMKWTRNTKYLGFMDAFQAPFTPKHRYWLGLLLSALITHNIVVVAMAQDKFVPVLSAGCIAHVLIFIKLVISPIYKNWLHDYLETLFLLTLAFLAYGTAYIGNASEQQRTLANISMATAFILFVVIVYYHFQRFIIKSTKTWLNVAILAYAISHINVLNADNGSHIDTLARLSLALVLTIVTAAIIYHCYLYLVNNTKIGRNFSQLMERLGLVFKEGPMQVNHKDNKEIEQHQLAEYHFQRAPVVEPYTDGKRVEPDPDHYITPPYVRPATRLDQLRAPYLDILAPITNKDYQSPPPTPPVESHPQPTYTIIEVTH